MPATTSQKKPKKNWKDVLKGIIRKKNFAWMVWFTVKIIQYVTLMSFGNQASEGQLKDWVVLSLKSIVLHIGWKVLLICLVTHWLILLKNYCYKNKIGKFFVNIVLDAQGVLNYFDKDN